MLSVWQKTGYRYSIDAPPRVSAPICAKKGEKWSSQCQPRLFYIHPRQLPCARHVMIMPAHLPPTNALTDNMRTKSHDAKKCHQWLKGRVIIVEPHGVGIELRTFVSTFYKWSSQFSVVIVRQYAPQCTLNTDELTWSRRNWLWNSMC